MDYLNSYKCINQGSKQKMNPIRRVGVDTHEAMNFTVSKNMSSSRYDINYTVTNAIPK